MPHSTKQRSRFLAAAYIGTALGIAGTCGAAYSQTVSTIPSFDSLWSTKNAEPTFTHRDIESLFSPMTDSESQGFRPAQGPASPDSTASTLPKSPKAELKAAGKAVKELLLVSPAEAEDAPQPAPAGAAAPEPDRPAQPGGGAAPQPESVPPPKEAAAPQPDNPSPPPREAAVPTPDRASPPRREAVAPTPTGSPARTAETAPTPRTPATTKAGEHRIGAVRASFYKHSGRTASGEIYKPNGLTAAHRTLPLGMRLRVVNQRNGRSVVVRINDRVPRTAKFPIDLSLGSAKAIGMTEVGIAPVALYEVR